MRKEGLLTSHRLVSLGVSGEVTSPLAFSNGLYTTDQRCLQTTVFLTVLEAGKPTIKALGGLVSGEGLLPGLQTAFYLLRPHTAEAMEELSGVSSVRH